MRFPEDAPLRGKPDTGDSDATYTLRLAPAGRWRGKSTPR